MSNDLINQITLSHLISKKQLEKLNKTNINENKNQKKHLYKDRIIDLFINLLDEKEPNDTMSDVKKTFDYFVSKSIYYFELHDAYLNVEKKDTNNEKEEYILDNDSKQDENTENNQEDTENNTEDEDVEQDEEEEEYDEEEDDEEEDEDDIEQNYSNQNNEPKIITSKLNSENIVYPKYKKTIMSQGVENINQLTLDWFTKVKKENQINKIIPRKQK